MVSKKTWWRGAHIRGELGTLFENKPPGSCILLKKGWGGGGWGAYFGRIRYCKLQSVYIVTETDAIPLTFSRQLPRSVKYVSI